MQAMPQQHVSPQGHHTFYWLAACLQPLRHLGTSNLRLFDAQLVAKDAGFAQLMQGLQGLQGLAAPPNGLVLPAGAAGL